MLQSKAWVSGMLSGKHGSKGSAAGPLDAVVTKVRELWAAFKVSEAMHMATVVASDVV